MTTALKYEQEINHDPTKSGHSGIIGSIVKYNDKIYIRTGLSRIEWTELVNISSGEYQFDVYMRENFPLVALDSLIAQTYKKIFISAFGLGAFHGR